MKHLLIKYLYKFGFITVVSYSEEVINPKYLA